MHKFWRVGLEFQDSGVGSSYEVSFCQTREAEKGLVKHGWRRGSATNFKV